MVIKQILENKYVKIIIIIFIISFCFGSGFFGGYSCGGNEYRRTISELEDDIQTLGEQNGNFRSILGEYARIYSVLGEGIKSREERLIREERITEGLRNELDKLRGKNTEAAGDYRLGYRIIAELEKRYKEKNN